MRRTNHSGKNNFFIHQLTTMESLREIMASLSLAKFPSENRDKVCTLLPAAKFSVEEFQLGTGYRNCRRLFHSCDSDDDVRR